MPEEKRSYTPSRRYDFQLKIQDLDYTNDLYKVRLISSANSAYQIFKFDIFVDPGDIISKRIFGKDPLKLNVRLLGDTQYPLEQIDFELMYLKGSFQFGQKNAALPQQKERTTFTIISVCRQPFKTITYTVNEVYLNTTIQSILVDLARKSGTTLYLDTENLNTDKLDQVLIPKTNLYNAIKYLDVRFGIFKGAAIVFCQHDNKLYIKNISSKQKMNQSFTIYQLNTTTDNTRIVQESLDGKTFYTYDKINTSSSANVKFSVLGNIEEYIMTPKDQFYYVLTKNLEDVSSEHGIIYKNKNIDFDPLLEHIQRIDENPCGYEISDSFAISKMAKYVANLSTVSLNLERNLPILNLINIGESVKLVSKIIEDVDLSGKYILKSSDLNFNKQKDWQCTCNLQLIRTNQTI